VVGLSSPTARRGSAATSATADLFRARVQARRRARLGWGLGSFVVLALLGYLLLGSPWLRVGQVRVEGLSRVPPASVQLVTAGERGRPMALVDAADLARRVADVPLVRSVEVVRRWPATLVVTVHERQPAAAVPAAGGGYRLLDRDGVLVDQVATRPATVPVLEVDVARVGAPALAAALDVLDGLPADLRKGLTSIGAGSLDDIWFTLDGTGRVVWGSKDDEQRKVVSLRALLGAEPTRASSRTVYDVSSPEAPAVSVGR
jgi:cell division protein FtsQ